MIAMPFLSSPRPDNGHDQRKDPGERLHLGFVAVSPRRRTTVGVGSHGLRLGGSGLLAAHSFRYYEQRRAELLLTRSGFCSSVAQDHADLLMAGGAVNGLIRITSCGYSI
jgi:hypothetical protein